MSGSIHVNSIARGISECDPVELTRSADNTRRLVFLPIIHSNKAKNGAVTGNFVYQRKLKADEWEKVPTGEEQLSKLKAGEGYRLELSTDAVTKLVTSLMDIEGIAEQVRSGRTNTTFVPTASDLAPLLKQLMESLDDGEALKELAKLGQENALRLNDLILNARIRSALKYWQEHKDDSDEETWQQFFSDRPWILSLISPEPIVVLKDKMYVGGTNASAKGGKTVDYGLINKQTNNTALLEIKTPKTQLLGSEYRGIFPLSSALSGSIIQVQTYKYSLLKNLPGLKEDFGFFEAANVPTYVLAGNTDQFKDDAQKRCFELGRKNSRDTIVITYDEVFIRLQLLLERNES